MSLPTIAVTAGEPAGIGPDLCVLLAQRDIAARLVVIADRDLLRRRATLLGVAFNPLDFNRDQRQRPRPGEMLVLHQPLAVSASPGRLDPANSASVLQTLRRAVEGCLDRTFDAMVTAPLHKGVINDSGFPFSGHTEFLAQHTGTPRVVMMLMGGTLRVALATTHLSLKAVPDAITREGLTQTLRILHRDLVHRFGIAAPRILVAGLNPHAGESGHMGREEIEVIDPALEQLRREGMTLAGPLPADTLFTPPHLEQADCVLAMYHDQGLPVLKYASFGGGVNVTLGLPIIRTSVDHGTALGRAGSGDIHSGSLLAAIGLALEMATRAGTERR